MAYLRYHHNCNWYVFWEVSEARTKEEELLAVWHIDHRKSAPSLTYAVVCSILSRDSLHIIPGYSTKDETLLREALQEFIDDVDEDYG